jgi:hypothetical protein
MHMISTRTACLAASLMLLSSAAPQTSDPASWKTATELPALDQSGLSAGQKRSLLEMLRTQGCNCGCMMKVAECRVKDPKCSKSRSLAAMAARELQEGKTSEQVRAGLERRMREAPSILDDPVPIPISGSPVKGAANARVTLVEFSDFQ